MVETSSFSFSRFSENQIKNSEADYTSDKSSSLVVLFESDPCSLISSLPNSPVPLF
jgi:hypothetical protein